MSLVRIHVCNSIPEAAVLKTVLAASGVPAFFQGANHAYVAWHHLFALGGIPILVPSNESRKAKDLIAEFPGPQTAVHESTLYSNAPIFNGAIASAAFLLFGLIFPFWIRERNSKNPNRNRFIYNRNKIDSFTTLTHVTQKWEPVLG